MTIIVARHLLDEAGVLCASARALGSVTEAVLVLYRNGPQRFCSSPETLLDRQLRCCDMSVERVSSGSIPFQELEPLTFFFLDSKMGPRLRYWYHLC